MYAVETDKLSKVYHSGLKAVDDISIKLENGEIFGFLGPNGAGKSTTIMILTTLLKPSSGKAFVAGFDVTTQAKSVRQNIGYVQQDSTVDEYLTGRENLELQARLNHIPKNIRTKRIDEILEIIELSDRQHETAVTYSGGMRKRLDIGGGLLNMPKVLFLDEPTLGLDIQTRYKIWEYIKKIHHEFGMSIFLTTHYMEEADKLCDNISIIDNGKIKITGSPKELKNALGNEIVVFEIDSESKLDRLVSEIKKTSTVKDVSTSGSMVTVFTTSGDQLTPQLFQQANNLQIKIESISLTKPTLDDVFLSYTGRELREDDGKYDRKKMRERMRKIRA
ncbi:ATP-binding cassette domain-containing protein [Candidatus Nitrosotalea okcheonensis]|uniref:Daunorubicin resistance ABC transporter ATPase subunit n=1 Tax=Candidatus Nitrosotalea okcheonensis TaxID=1903276 RepID=A0A2H1FBR5_9ARCH|nr:ATP-binding cassette domain-containing protein [Candidatus Nitrosotalea okcheonensis]MDE1728294.1 ATP-binding cassette domain-containing protein [Nitrososphaerota archaeon]SMH70213.1 Daunorubicin resistance ABC transporter ATPase subunit [Candidatus Nitrosotalea okcheonensis]